jgi:ABC-type multidrug transport system fused ATPase/permease subunit
MKYIAWLWRELRGFRANVIIRVMVGVGRVALGLLMIWLSKRFIDETIRTGTNDDVVRMIVFLVLTVVGSIVLRLVYYYMSASAMVRKSNALRLFFFDLLFKRKLYGEQELHSGDVASRLMKDVDTVCTSTMDTIPQMMVTGVQLVGAFLLMRWFDARLAWALLLLTPLVIVIGKIVSRKLRNMTLEIRKSESQIQMQVQEAVEYNVVMRSLESESWVTGLLKGKQEKLEHDVLRRTRFTTISRFSLGSAFGLGYLLAFIWGALGLRDGAITIGTMTSFLQLVGQIQHPILTLLGMVPQLVHSTASIDRLEELKCDVQPQEGARLQNGTAGRLGVRLENVSFGYAKDLSKSGENVEVISRFSHDFRPGSKTAIMGETGTGKTTLFRLLLGFVEPDEGRVLIYSEDALDGVREVSKGTRKDFVYVPQGNTLMSGTIRHNLQFANPDADDDALREALHAACADFVLDLPNGLDTELGERGHGLSEGQSQRIAIARGLLRPGNILLFDEISSSLDESTERELYKRLFEMFPNKTMIFVTHRPAICQMCDEIVKITSG